MNSLNKSEILFFKVWRNNYLKSCILKHLNHYKYNQCFKAISRNELINYEFRNYISMLIIKFDEAIQEKDIPEIPELCELEFDFRFNQRINFKLPENILELTFGGSFNQSLKTDKGESILPSNLKSISIGYGFRQKFDINTFPSSIEHISFNQLYQPLDQILPPNSSIKTLCLGYCYNRELKINDIPSTVQTLMLPFKYNKPLVLPLHLKHLYLGHDFNQPILPGDLPSTLQILSLGVMFNQELLPGAIPNGVELLQFSDFYSHPLTVNTIPSSVTRLVLKGYLKSFQNLSSCPEIIPSSVTDISFHFSQEIPLSFANLISSNPSIMSSVKKFRFNQIGYSYYSKMIPRNVTDITFSKSFSYSLGPGDIPLGVTKISFETIDSLILLKPNTIPSTVEHLSINIVDDLRLKEVENRISLQEFIPSTIKKMTVTGFNAKHLNRIIPRSVSELTIIYFRGQIHDPNNIPSTISKTIIKKFNYKSYKNMFD